MFEQRDTFIFMDSHAIHYHGRVQKSQRWGLLLRDCVEAHAREVVVRRVRLERAVLPFCPHLRTRYGTSSWQTR